jgi:FMN phosphatase YigB (HAD superfamily)
MTVVAHGATVPLDRVLQVDGSGRRVAAVLFDVDGTLYRQAALRSLMALELALLPLQWGSGATRAWRLLSAFRAAQEHLRREPRTDTPLVHLQIRRAAAAAGLSEAEATRVVAECFFRRPLKYLHACRTDGVLELLDFLTARGVRTGVLSDYDPVPKLEALGLRGRFDPVLCTTDRTINALKPHPEGFLAACRAWSLDPADVLYVGDRFEVDAAGAHAAGMPCVIISRAVSHRVPAGTHVVSSFERLARDLRNRC